MIGCSMPKDGTTWLTARRKALEEQIREKLVEAENKMVAGDYAETMRAALWAAGEGEAIVPVMVALLDRRIEYRQREAGFAGAYPFNVLWVLARVDSVINLPILENYYAGSGDKRALLAIAGCKLRRISGNGGDGVLMFDNRNLYSEANRTSSVKMSLAAGEEVTVLSCLQNVEEQDDYGEIQIYDYIRLKASGTTGYIARQDGKFSPFI